jgi:hypothetical protein
MKVMCNQCWKILDLMMSQTFAVDEGGRLRTHNFCSEEHMIEFTRRKGMAIGKR